MPIPDFVVEMREKIGHGLLWLPGVTGLVVDESERVLLVRRADTLEWALVTGILEPGEQPALGVVREIFEETGVHAAVERVLAVEATRRIEYPNGDRSVYLDVAFVCRPTGGTARVNDDESVDVGWFPLRELPALSARQTTCVRHYLEGHESAWFARP